MGADSGQQGKLIFAGDRPAATLSAAVGRGDLQRLARGVYTDEVARPAPTVVRERWLEIAAHLFPGSVITDRSGPRAGPIDGVLHLSGPRQAVTELPGLTITSRRGPGPVEGDLPLPFGLHLASRARALLDNARPTRRGKHRPRPTLAPDELADWIDHLCAVEGEDALITLRGQVAALAPELDAPADHADRVDALIGAALGTRPAPGDSTALAARSRGLPFDQERVARFDVLVQALLDRPVANVPALPEDAEQRRQLPFFEAYFSNFIEGTEFSPEEAEEIVRTGVAPSDRPADGLDVLGTYRLLADEADLAREPATAADLLDRLRAWNASIMAGRPEVAPGEWKQRANRAGATEFVAPDLVVGTLVQGWERLPRLHTPFQRAVLMLFVVSEVHPFTDGNGRVARVAMSAELAAGAQVRAVVPTICRNDYLNGLRRLTRQDRPDLLIDAMDRLQRFTSRIDFSDTATARRQLGEANAFVDAADAERRGLHLRMP